MKHALAFSESNRRVQHRTYSRQYEIDSPSINRPHPLHSVTAQCSTLLRLGVHVRTRYKFEYTHIETHPSAKYTYDYSHFAARRQQQPQRCLITLHAFRLSLKNRNTDDANHPLSEWKSR